jgi:hypothetical protein
MKKIVRLTESDLTRIVVKILNEQPTADTTNTKLPPSCGSQGIQRVKSALSGGGLEKIEFDYQNGAAFFSLKGEGKVCGVKIQDFMGMF